MKVASPDCNKSRIDVIRLLLFLYTPVRSSSASEELQRQDEMQLLISRSHDAGRLNNALAYLPRVYTYGLRPANGPAKWTDGRQTQAELAPVILLSVPTDELPSDAN
jgi:hypothetical protein